MAVEQEFEDLLADKRHRELVASLNAIASELKKADSNNDAGIIEAINKQAEKIQSFVDAIKNIPKAETPTVNVETNQYNVVQSIGEMATSILSGINELKQSFNVPQKQKQFQFNIVRNKFSGFIESVTAKET